MSTSFSAALRTLAESFGVILEYDEASPEHPRIIATDEQLIAHLEARGVACRSLEEVGASLEARRAKLLSRSLEPVYSGSPTDCFEIQVLLPPGYDTAEIRYLDGSGQHTQPLHCLQGPVDSAGGVSYNRYRLVVPGLENWGFHDIEITFRGPGGLERHARTRVIIGPDRFWQPPPRRAGYFGATTMLSSLTSRHPDHYGRGNFGDAKRAVRQLAGYGADFFAPGPLNQFDWPDDVPTATPFMPLSELLTHHCLDFVETMRRLRLTDCLGRLESPEMQAKLIKLRMPRLIDVFAYDVMLMDKLRQMWSEFKEKHLGSEPTELGGELKSFIDARGEEIRKPAVFLALRTHFFPRGETNAMWNWRNWPDEYRQWNSPTVAEFALEHANEINFIAFVQWLVHLGLTDLVGETSSVGMELGLVMNLPIGVSAAAAETWYEGELFFDNLVNGCPPDPLDRRGQSWGYPIWDPEALLEAGLEPFVRKIRALMRYGRGLEVDHGMRFERCFVYPSGADASCGVYVRCPMEHLLRALALLSHQQEFFVAPELVGTKSEEIDDVMRRWGALSLTQQCYDRNSDGRLKRPQECDCDALYFGGCHNHFSETAKLLGVDISISQRIRGEEAAVVETVRRHRRQEIREQLEMLQELGLFEARDVETLLLLAANPVEDVAELEYLSEIPVLRRYSIAAHISRAMTSALVVAVDLFEAMLVPLALNAPGVSNGYPSWLLRLPPVEDWPNKPLIEVLAAIQRVRGR